jgi:hypothetical protein
MAQYSLDDVSDEDELQDSDRAPYDSISDREPLENVSAPAQAPSPSDAVKGMITQRMGAKLAPLDPLIQQFDQQQKGLNDFRQAKQHADYITNMGQAFSQAALGANTPTQNPVYQAIAAQNQHKETEQESDLARRQKVTEAIAQRQARQDLAKYRGQQMQSKQVDKMVTALKDDLDPNKARGGNFAANQKRVDNADRVQALLEQVHSDPDARQMEELAISTQALLSSSGTPAANQVKELIPHTAWGNAKKLQEWLTNDPTGTGQQAFVQRLADTVAREKQVALDQVQKAQKQRLSAHGALKRLDPDSYNSVLRSYGVDDNPQPKVSAPASKEQVGTVIQHNGKKYKVGADGDSLEEI